LADKGVEKTAQVSQEQQDQDSSAVTGAQKQQWESNQNREEKFTRRYTEKVTKKKKMTPTPDTR
jgi:hypothetical protein